MNTKNDWIKMTDRRPTEQDLPVWVWPFGDNGAPVIFQNLAFSGNSSVSHWRPAAADIPQSPAITQDDLDESGYGAWDSNQCGHNAWTAWHAALAWERAQVAKMLPASRYECCPTTKAWDAIEAIRARCAGGGK